MKVPEYLQTTTSFNFFLPSTPRVCEYYYSTGGVALRLQHDATMMRWKGKNYEFAVEISFKWLFTLESAILDWKSNLPKTNANLKSRGSSWIKMYNFKITRSLLVSKVMKVERVVMVLNQPSEITTLNKNYRKMKKKDNVSQLWKLKRSQFNFFFVFGSSIIFIIMCTNHHNRLNLQIRSLQYRGHNYAPARPTPLLFTHCPFFSSFHLLLCPRCLEMINWFGSGNYDFPAAFINSIAVLVAHWIEVHERFRSRTERCLLYSLDRMNEWLPPPL